CASSALQGPRRSPGATSCTPSGCGSCPPGCCCSTRRRASSAARCASPRAACAKELFSKSSPPWDPEAMAKARPVDLNADMTFAEAASVTIATRIHELFAWADQVLDTEDIERVHDMRVANRLLAAAQPVFRPC